jgi:predicted transcriptional regulator
MKKYSTQDLIQLVKESPSSIFSKDDVLNLLQSVDSSDVYERLVNAELGGIIEEAIQHNLDTLSIDKYEASFSLIGNEIMLEDVPFETEDFERNVISYVNNEIQAFLADAKIKNVPSEVAAD